MTVILHEHKLIFIRGRKIAGTAIEIELSKFANTDDVITEVSPRDEEIRAAAGGRRANNKVNSIDFYNHMPATLVRQLLGRRIWDSYLSFTIERNPWDKVVSMFFHRVGRRTSCTTLSQFIESGEFKDANNFGLYSENQSPIVSYVGKYEVLDSDLNYVFAQAGLPFSGLSTSPKSQFRPKADNFRAYYTESDRDAVERAYREEIEFHGYRFDPN